MAGGYVETVAEDPVAALEEEDRAQLARGSRSIALVVLALAALAVGAYLLLRPEKTTVPDVVGKRSGDAAQTLPERAASRSTSSPIQSDTVAEDRVAGQRPEPGRGGRRGLDGDDHGVRAGPGEAPVPVVAGPAGRRGGRRLREAGFKSEQRREFSDTVRERAA